MFENGQEDIVDENGNEAVDWEEEVNPHNTETLSNFIQYSEKQPTDLDMTEPKLPERMAQLEKTINAGTKSKYLDYSDSQKTLFLHYLQLKLLSAAASARKAAINVRTGQYWAKKLKNDPDYDIFEKQTNKTFRKESQLQDEHKAYLIEFFFYNNPHARISDAVEELTKKI